MAGREFGKNAEAYDAHRPHFRDGFHAGVMDRLVEHAEFSAGDVVVEIGSGTGLGTEAFLARGINVIGVEPDAEMLKVALRRLGSCAVRDEVVFHNRRASGQPAAYFVHATFEEAANDGHLQDAYDGVAAITSIHWPIRQDGLEVTTKRLVDLLKPGKHLATLHTPLNVYSKRAAEFFLASQAFWPPEYMADLPNRTTVALKRTSEVAPYDFKSHFIPIHYQTWTRSQDIHIDDYLDLIQTYWEINELTDEVRERFMDDLRQLSLKKFDAIVPTTHATFLQVDKKPE